MDDVKALNLNNEEVDALIIEAEKAIERHKNLKHNDLKKRDYAKNEKQQNKER